MAENFHQSCQTAKPLSGSSTGPTDDWEWVVSCLAAPSSRHYKFSMKLHGQRWLYRVGNAEIIVDNAFSWWGWAQERWLINGDIVRETGGWFALKRSFDEPWLTPLGNGILSAELRSRIASVECLLTLDGERQNYVALFEASWFGRGVWPAGERWTEVESFSVFNALRLRRRRRSKSLSA